MSGSKAQLSLVSETGGLTPGGDNMVWILAMRDYFTMMRAAGRSPLTIRLHRHYLHQLWEVQPAPWNVTTPDLLELLGRPSWGSESRKSARTVYRGFYGWAMVAGRVVKNPALGLPPVRVSPGAPRPTPEPIAQTVMHSLDPRLAFMAMLAGYCGLRAAEIAKVHQFDFDPSSLRLVIHGKGSKERVIPIVQPELVVMLSQVRGWAFPGRTDGHLSSGHVTVLLSRAMPAQWTGHTLRHRAGTKAYRGTRDIYAVARMLGHSRTETTQRYVQLDDDALLAALTASAA